jgi:hypothetical protein
MNSTFSRTPPNLDDYAIADTSTTGHYLKPTSPHLVAQTATNPIHVQMPNRAGLASIHTCTLNAPSLPPKACDGHILPGLSSHSLLSIAKFCNQGCDVRFSTNVCQVFLNNVLLLEGPIDPTTNLWLLPLCPKPRETPAAGHMRHLGMPIRPPLKPTY